MEQVISLLQQAWNHPDFWLYAAIPAIAGGIGWATNWLAIKMTFFPVEPIGWPPFFGWQGVIPSRSEKMSGIFVDNSLAKLGTTAELFEAFETDELKDHLVRSLKPRIEEFIDDIMRESNVVVWENLPSVTKRLVYARARSSIPRIADSMMQEINERSEELIDMHGMATDLLTRDKTLLNRMFMECGEAELNFVIKAGLYLGFMFGVVQMLAWIYYPEWWVLPGFGFLVGATTNWIALNAIFRPLHPYKIGPVTFLGLFIKRQEEVSKTFARLSTADVLTVGNLMENIMNGPNEIKTRKIIRRHLRPAIDDTITKLLAQMTFGPTGYVDLKDRLENATLSLSKEIFADQKFNRDRAPMIEKMLYERMSVMSPEEYQDLIRPAFKEDEWILIAIGGALGFAAGVGQLMLLFGQSFL